MTTHLYIVRHAECANNVTRIILPPEKDLLTEHGILQAKLLGKHLEGVHFTKAISSDYPRCMDTAFHILSESKYPAAKELKIEPDERLRERNVGIYEGGELTAAVKYLGGEVFGKGIPVQEVEFPGDSSDSNAVMRQRAKSFWNDIFELVDKSEKESESILTTAHGFSILYLVDYLMNSPDQVQLVNHTGNLFKVSPNSGVLKLAISKKTLSENGSSPRKVDVLTEYDRSHLATLQKDDPVGSFAKGTKFEGCIHQ